MLNAEGSYTGALFSREATVGLEGGFGSVKLGRQTTIIADAVGAYDPMKAGFAVSPLGFNGGYSGGGFTNEARWDNSLKYAYNINNELTARFGMRTGNIAGASSVGSAYAANVEYNGGNWGTVLGYVSTKDAMSNYSADVSTSTGATTVAYPAMGVKLADTTATLLAFRVNQGSFTYKFGVENIKFVNPANTTGIGSINSLYGIPVTAYNVTGYTTPLTQNMYFLGANWQVSAPLELSAAYYRRTDSAYGNSGPTATSWAYTLTNSSKADYLSFMANYSLSKRTRLYATANFTKVSGPVWTSASTASSVTTQAASTVAGAYGTLFTQPNLQVFTFGVAHTF
jgi:predicted porin